MNSLLTLCAHQYLISSFHELALPYELTILGYYHELFLRGKPFLCKRMFRTKIKGTRFKAASSPDQEPDFYAMPPVVENNNSTDKGVTISKTTSGGGGAVTPPSSSSSIMGSAVVPPPLSLNPTQMQQLLSLAALQQQMLPNIVSHATVTSMLPSTSSSSSCNNAGSYYRNSTMPSSVVLNNRQDEDDDLSPTPLATTATTASMAASKRGTSFYPLDDAVAQDFSSLFGSSSSSNARTNKNEAASSVLDQAVQDMFASSGATSLDAFLWDANQEMQPEDQEPIVLETDEQLGNMLDKFLEEW
jgi:hypothetical protein